MPGRLGSDGQQKEEEEANARHATVAVAIPLLWMEIEKVSGFGIKSAKKESKNAPTYTCVHVHVQAQVDYEAGCRSSGSAILPFWN